MPTIPSLSYFDDPDHWVTKDTHRYRLREPWFPLAHAVPGWEREFHELMLRDHLRMSKFRAAIRQAMFYLVAKRTSEPPLARPLRVMDVGTGYGILAYWATKYFRAARDTLIREGVAEKLIPHLRIYAIEANPVTAGEAYRLLSEEGLAYSGPSSAHAPADGQVLVCPCTSYHFARFLEESRPVLRLFDPLLLESCAEAGSLDSFKADLIVSETFGSIVDSEDGVSIVANAVSRYLGEDGLTIPEKATSFLVPISGDPETGIHARIAAGKCRGIADLYKAQSASTQTFCYDAIIPASDYLSEEAEPVHTWRFERSQYDTWKVNYRKTLLFPITRSGALIGLKGFFRMVLTSVGDEPVLLDIESSDVGEKGTADCWKHLYLPISKPIQVAAGGTVSVTFERRSDLLSNGGDVYYSWRIATADLEEHGSYQTQRFYLPREQSHLTEPLVSLCQFIEGRTEGTLLPTTESAAREVVTRGLDSLFHGETAADGGVQRVGSPVSWDFARVFFGWPLGTPKNSRFLWFSVTPPSRSSHRGSDGPSIVEFVDSSRTSLPTGGTCLSYKVVKGPEGDDCQLLFDAQVFSSPDSYSRWEDELREALREGGFLSLLIIPDEITFSVAAGELRDLEGAAFLLQARLLVELLIEAYRTKGREEQSRDVAHEIGQIAPIFRVAESSSGASAGGRLPAGSLIWWVRDYEAALEHADHATRDELARTMRERGVLTFAGRSLAAGSKYLDLLSASTSVGTPFHDWAGRDMGVVLEDLIEFATHATFPGWSQGRVQHPDGELSVDVIQRAVGLEDEYFHWMTRTRPVRLVRPEVAKRYSFPDATDDATFLKAVALDNDSHRAHVGPIITRLLGAAILNSLKHAFSSERLEDISPVIVLLDDAPGSGIRVLVANRFVRLAPGRLPRWMAQEAGAAKYGTAAVLENQRRLLHDMGVPGVEVVFEVSNTAFLRAQEREHLRLLPDDDIFLSGASFSGVSARLFGKQVRDPN